MRDTATYNHTASSDNARYSASKYDFVKASAESDCRQVIPAANYAIIYMEEIVFGGITGESMGWRELCSLLCPIALPHQPHADSDQDPSDEGKLSD